MTTNSKTMKKILEENKREMQEYFEQITNTPEAKKLWGLEYLNKLTEKEEQ